VSDGTLIFMMVFSQIGDLTQRMEGHRFVSDPERSLLGHANACGTSAAAFGRIFESDRKTIISSNQRIWENVIPYLSILRRILSSRTRRLGQGGITSGLGDLKTSNTPSRRLTPVGTKPGSLSCFRKTDCVKDPTISRCRHEGFRHREQGILRKVQSRAGMGEKVVSESIDIVHFLPEFARQKT
jgi:hypothetical protein